MKFAVSPAVALEYEDVLKRPGLLGQHSWMNAEDMDIVLDAVFGCATLTSPWFRFRPFLNDPKDDLYVECALAAGAAVIVSQDKHFDHPSLRAFGLVAMNARDYLVRHHDRSNPE
ncbi:PIN domain-containing protein [Rhizobium sp. FKL33]|uniref:PIN domain-containing protein n=1 Tax=Rhizobium sp. FKL33 TaxID=2562307 RepID=UPI0010BF86EF|nr:PIN domain-containing protein [Rhizobium sp. FKL33]